jgi:hypothetical protein
MRRVKWRGLTQGVLVVLISGSCSRSIEDAFPRYQLSPDVTQSSGQFFLSTEGLVQRDSAAVETEVVKCSGSLRGIREVVSGTDIVLVVACGSEFQMTVTFLLNGELVETVDRCDLGTDRLPPDSDRPWRSRIVEFSPFSRIASCSI